MTATDLRVCGLKPILDIDKILNETQEEIAEFKATQQQYHEFKYPMDDLVVREGFQHPPTGCGRKAQLTLMTVDQAVNGFDEIDKDICNLNRGWMEFSVAGVILWRHIVSAETKEFLDQSGIFKIPLVAWKKGLADWCNDVRRYNGIGHDDLEIDGKIAGMIRKLINLSGRDLLPADFEAEAEHIKATYSVRKAPSEEKRLSTKAWDESLDHSIQELVSILETKIFEGMNLRPFHEWWATRRAWVASGSSSEKHRMQELKQDDARLTRSDRPTKKQTIETMDIDDILKALLANPIAIARASTKPEPGFKRRALYASDDISTYIASYASADIEKAMCIGGMVTKQTPAEVMQWLQADLLRSQHPERIWLSLDYSDFNKEHTKIALTKLNLALAKMWNRQSKYAHSKDIFIMKALCSFWVARSHLNSWCNEADGTIKRHYSGLWSGHRDTARDNTMLHWCYSNIVKKSVLKTMGLDCKLHYLGICGDDEDGVHDDWVSMAAYIGMHRLCGLKLNPVKQLSDWYAHEFLQRQANKNSMPIRPLAPMIATLSTGSWYKQSYVYYDTIITSINDNCREILARGADPLIIRKVAAVLISRMMTVNQLENIDRDDDEEAPNVKLEWWKYRHGASGEDNNMSLWHGTGNATPMPILDEIQFQNNPKAPRKALTDWVKEKHHWISKLTEKQSGEYEEALLYDSYKSYYGRLREKQREYMAVGAYGLRENKITTEDIDEMFNNGELILPETIIDKEKEQYIWRRINTMDIERRPITLEVLLDKIGLDRQLYDKIGGKEGFFRFARNEDLAKWEEPVEPLKVKIPDAMVKMDPAIISWWRIENSV
jgi:hypothetical protein